MVISKLTSGCKIGFNNSCGGVCVSGTGCITNDLWDRNIDKKVARTRNRPIAKGAVGIASAIYILIAMVTLSFLALISLPKDSLSSCIPLSLIALAAIAIYPSFKRWFPYPQGFLAFCWGFSVLIPWAAIEKSIEGFTLLFCWVGTLCWTFGFDTVYALPDRNDDLNLGVKSSAISLGENTKKIVSISYAITSISILIAALLSKITWIFWPIWLISTVGMQREIILLNINNCSIGESSKHFKNQVLLGGLILFGLIISNG